ncbi:MAG: hypothetical protein EOM59_14160 [Clostridia bacterium]|nr:hypothetical protein [Clostridia bacterium]
MTRIITDADELNESVSKVRNLAVAYWDLLNYAKTLERTLLVEKSKRMYDAETQHDQTWAYAKKELVPRARQQLMTEIGFRGLYERNSK